MAPVPYICLPSIYYENFRKLCYFSEIWIQGRTEQHTAQQQLETCALDWLRERKHEHGPEVIMREVALLTSAGGDGLATVVDVLTGTQITSLKNCSAQPGSTALIAGDFVASAQVGARQRSQARARSKVAAEAGAAAAVAAAAQRLTRTSGRGQKLVCVLFEPHPRFWAEYLELVSSFGTYHMLGL